ncbi:MAG: HAD-IA family hydrolase [Clostridium sp.]|nr:HAD-IA family hydrolase [Clostridium sp.]
MKYELVIFDMDGTILDTLEDLADAMNTVLRKFGYPEHSVEEIRRFVGNGIRKLVERAVPEGISVDTLEEMYGKFMEYYQEHCADKTKAYDGIPELLNTLRKAGCKTAVVSNKADAAVKELCRQYFDGCFDFAVGERSGILKKPAPDSVNEVLRQLDVEAGKAVYIGDSEVDIATAENAGIDSIIVSWGFREKEFLLKQGAKIIIDYPKEAADIVLAEIRKIHTGK